MTALVMPDRRVSLSAVAAAAAAAPQLEAVFLGAPPAGDTPNFAAATAALTAAAQIGFMPVAGDETLLGLPLAFSSLAAFAAVFPDDTWWLARSVADYFGAGGLRAWVVLVAADPAQPIDAYVRQVSPAAFDAPLSGVQIAAQIPSVGLLLVPDLEYLCYASLPSPPVTLPASAATPPGFRPATDFVTTPPPSNAAAPVAAKVDPSAVLVRISSALAQLRPDMQLLFALPIGDDQTQSIAALTQQADGWLHSSALSGGDLPQVQAFAPMLRDMQGSVVSPSGLVAGYLCATAESDGVWRSIAGRPLPLGYMPVRRIASNALSQLRSSGVATLRFDPAGTVLDDDVLACKLAAANRQAQAAKRAAGTRRLFGWLLRNLQSLGQQLVFQSTADAGQVALILTDVFTVLQQRGALTGTQFSDAVRITQRDIGMPNAVQFDIAVAAALAMETICLRFEDGGLTASFGAAA